MSEQQPLIFDCRYQWQDGQVRVIVEGFEVLLVLFDPKNFSDALFEKLKLREPFLTVSDETRAYIHAQVRRIESEKGREVTDEQMVFIERELIRRIELQFIKESIETAANAVNKNLQKVTELVWEKVIQASSFSGGNALRDILNLPYQKFSAKDIKEALFRDDWERIKPIAGVAHGGARTRKAGFVWDEEKAVQLYQTVEALPRHGADDLPMWEYAHKMLADNDYDHETILFLKSRPVFQDVPDELLKEAADVWRRYDESWDSLPPDSSPQAFAFRHACHKLGFPYKAYNTVRTNYYRGRKVAENTG
ncbi:MAG TPA: hypothetical protein VK421_14290 [Pyrinomonadaceae bacterium]|nr:hypothetical protein [Pyrinomonadaceae bacterium]